MLHIYIYMNLRKQLVISQKSNNKLSLFTYIHVMSSFGPKYGELNQSIGINKQSQYHSNYTHPQHSLLGMRSHWQGVSPERSRTAQLFSNV